jgi:hypothetical protein
MPLQVYSLPKLEGFSLQVKIYLAPEDVEKWLAAFKPIFELVSAEPDCLFFELYQDPEHPGNINWVENWYVRLQYVVLSMLLKTHRNKSPDWFMTV